MLERKTTYVTNYTLQSIQKYQLKVQFDNVYVQNLAQVARENIEDGIEKVVFRKKA